LFINVIELVIFTAVAGRRRNMIFLISLPLTTLRWNTDLHSTTFNCLL